MNQASDNLEKYRDIVQKNAVTKLRCQWITVGLRYQCTKLARLSRRPRHNRVQLLTQCSFLLHQIKVNLQAQKEAFGHAVIARQAQVSVGGHGAFAEHDLVDAARGNGDGAG